MFPLRLMIPGVVDGLVKGLAASRIRARPSPHGDAAAGSDDGALGHHTSNITVSVDSSTSVRIVAFDRVTFGFSGRPSSWSQAEDGNPYTIDAGVM